ncbi:hypothetical protein [Mesorhizobium sp. M0895]|uniref:hypothetical protein n=1 Tax=Mesorhizobium sp. M0895 TaxID=2957019 RepID=UPI00333D48F5
MIGIDARHQPIHDDAAIVEPGEQGKGLSRLPHGMRRKQAVGHQRLQFGEQVRLCDECSQSKSIVQAVQRFQMRHDPAGNRLQSARGRLKGADAPVFDRQMPDETVMQHLLQEGVGGVAAGHRMPADVVHEPCRRKSLAMIVRLSIEIQAKADMGHQPTLLRGEYGGQPRVRFIGLEKRPRLSLDMATQCRMAGNVFRNQRHPRRAQSNLQLEMPVTISAFAGRVQSRRIRIRAESRRLVA